MEGDLAGRCLHTAVHAWAEGHLAAPDHPEPAGPAEVDTALEAFARAVGLDLEGWELVGNTSTADGELDADDLIADVRDVVRP